MKMEAERYVRMKEAAWASNRTLTPRGEQLREDHVVTQIKAVKDQYTVVVTPITDDEDDRYYECVVRGKNPGSIGKTLRVQMDPNLFGAHESTCTCGRMKKGGVPCHHLIAVLTSGKIPQLNTRNVMAYAWTTSLWKLQFPHDSTINCNISMEYLKHKYDANDKVRYLPDFVGKRKRGRPKKNKRIKSQLEVALGEGKRKRKRKWRSHADPESEDDLELDLHPKYDDNLNLDGDEGAL